MPWLASSAASLGGPRAAPEALGLVRRYVMATSRQEQPEALVMRLVAVVGETTKEEIMTVADMLEERGVQRGLRETLLKLLRARFGEVPEAAVARIQTAGKAQLDEVLAEG